jgi:hypothetical protein
VQIIKMAPTNAERIMDLAEKMELVIQRLDLMNQNPSEIENGKELFAQHRAKLFQEPH